MNRIEARMVDKIERKRQRNINFLGYGLGNAEINDYCKIEIQEHFLDSAYGRVLKQRMDGKYLVQLFVEGGPQYAWLGRRDLTKVSGGH